MDIPLIEPFLITLMTSLLLTIPFVLARNLKTWGAYTGIVMMTLSFVFLCAAVSALYIDGDSPLADVVRAYYRTFMRPDIINDLLAYVRVPASPNAKYFPPWAAE